MRSAAWPTPTTTGVRGSMLALLVISNPPASLRAGPTLLTSPAHVVSDSGLTAVHRPMWAVYAFKTSDYVGGVLLVFPTPCTTLPTLTASTADRGDTHSSIEGTLTLTLL